jgi:hypothetical protein
MASMLVCKSAICASDADGGRVGDIRFDADVEDVGTLESFDVLDVIVVVVVVVVDGVAS